MRADAREPAITTGLVGVVSKQRAETVGADAATAVQAAPVFKESILMRLGSRRHGRCLWSGNGNGDWLPRDGALHRTPGCAPGGWWHCETLNVDEEIKKNSRQLEFPPSIGDEEDKTPLAQTVPK